MSDNYLSIGLNLDTEVGRKALTALAAAVGDPLTPPRVVVNQTFNPVACDTGAGVVADEPAVEPVVQDEEPLVHTVAEHGQEPPTAKAPSTAGKPRRRRKKAEIEEDERDGLAEAYEKAAKDNPDLSVDEIRALIRGGALDATPEAGDGEPSGAPDQAVTTDASEPAVADEDAYVGSSTTEEGWAPQFSGQANPTVANPPVEQAEEPAPATPAADEWEPQWD